MVGPQRHRHHPEAVVVVIEGRLIAQRQQLAQVTETPGKPALHIPGRDVMAAAGHPVGDAADRFLGGIQPHIVQPHGVALVPGRAGHLAEEAAGEGAFLGEVDALGQAVLQLGNSHLAPGVFIAAVLGNDAIRVHDHAEHGEHPDKAPDKLPCQRR